MSVRFIASLNVFAVLLLAGCEPPRAQFASSKRTENLIPEAREPLRAILTESFGTPQHLVAWLRLPVDYGSYTGAVAEAGARLSRKITVRFDAEVETLNAGLELHWKTGKYEGTSRSIADYSPQMHTLTLQQQLEEPPAVGDKFVVSGHILQKGRKLYMTHCMHCHGVTGDGNGPTARYLNPRPRDYRLGIFKFTSTKQTIKASREDLKRTIKLGIPGTYMPSFMLLEDDLQTAIVEYVRWLSMRGEYEKKMVDELDADYSSDAVRQRVEEGEERGAILEELAAYIEADFPEAIDEAATDLADAWSHAEEKQSIVIPQKKRTVGDAASIQRGRKLYLSEKAKCATCHGPTGRGDGPQTETYTKIPGTNQEHSEPGLFDDWGNKIKPRNLRRGIYRGGRRPIDIYRRIYAGIKGTPMPAFGPTVLKDDEIWDLVNYVMAVPYTANSSISPDEQKQVASEPRRSQSEVSVGGRSELKVR